MACPYCSKGWVDWREDWYQDFHEYQCEHLVFVHESDGDFGAVIDFSADYGTRRPDDFSRRSGLFEKMVRHGVLPDYLRCLDVEVWHSEHFKVLYARDPSEFLKFIDSVISNEKPRVVRREAVEFCEQPRRGWWLDKPPRHFPF